MWGMGLWARLVEWAKFTFEEEEKLSDHERVMRHLNPGNPEDIEVDWTQAPSDAIEWRFDPKSANHGRWLNGNKTFEEFGVVHEWEWAPSFGATQRACVKITPGDRARQAAHRLSEATRPSSAESEISPRRL